MKELVTSRYSNNVIKYLEDVNERTCDVKTLKWIYKIDLGINKKSVFEFQALF